MVPLHSFFNSIQIIYGKFQKKSSFYQFRDEAIY